MANTNEKINFSPRKEESHSMGFSFGLPAQIVGGALTIMGLVMLLSFSIGGIILGPAPLFAGIFLLTASYGVQIDYSNRYFREYSSLMGIKYGKWLELDKFPFLTILTANKTNKSSDITGLNSVVFTKEAYGVYLLTNSHRKRILLMRCEGGFEHAKLEAERIAYLTNKELVAFSPKRISNVR